MFGFCNEWLCEFLGVLMSGCVCVCVRGWVL